jgi:DNA/RNA-binding domain of Phe-tRNA-synthetase-like protein
MTKMKLVISEAIRKKYSALRIGVVVADEVNNLQYADGLEKYVEQTFKTFAQMHRDDFESAKNIMLWRDIYRSFGVNPKKKKPTAESLLLRVIDNHIPHISPAVDAYLVAETLSMLPIGGYDLNKIHGDIKLDFAVGGEDFLGVGLDGKVEQINHGEVIYHDDAIVLTRRWNYRDAEATKIDERTTRLALFVEAPVVEISDGEVQNTLEEIANNLQKFCGACAQTQFLDAKHNEIAL